MESNTEAKLQLAPQGRETIGLLITLCSRNQKYITLGHADIFTWLLSSFFETYEPDKFNYKFLIGYDDDDEFYIKNHDYLKKRIGESGTITILEGCQKNPCKAWNILLQKNCDLADYFYQVGSDIKLLSKGWSSYFVNLLKKNRNVGICGGVDKQYWLARIIQNQNGIIENAFFHKTHYEIFGSIFNNEFKTWFSDDYITRIYMINECCYLSPNILFRNMNRVGQQDYNDRYDPDTKIKDKWLDIANKDSIKIFNYKKKLILK